MSKNKKSNPYYLTHILPIILATSPLFLSFLPRPHPRFVLHPLYLTNIISFTLSRAYDACSYYLTMYFKWWILPHTNTIKILMRLTCNTSLIHIEHHLSVTLWQEQWLRFEAWCWWLIPITSREGLSLSGMKLLFSVTIFARSAQEMRLVLLVTLASEEVAPVSLECLASFLQGDELGMILWWLECLIWSEHEVSEVVRVTWGGSIMPIVLMRKGRKYR